MAAALGSGFFRNLVTVELSEQLHGKALKRFSGTHVECLRGSSSDFMESLSGRFRHPVFFYLDAHWFSKKYGAHPDVSDKDPFPLWKELEILRKRPYSDIISVDDVHAFGRSSAGIDSKWEEVSGDSIKKALGEGRVVHSLEISDQFVVYRK